MIPLSNTHKPFMVFLLHSFAGSAPVIALASALALNKKYQLFYRYNRQLIALVSICVGGVWLTQTV